MAVEQFITKAFRKDSLAIIETANTICRTLRAQGYNLTLRQLYYQFVSHHGMPNRDENYKRLGNILSDARLAGLMDWDHMQDRTRAVVGGFGGYQDAPGDYMDSVADGYGEFIWKGQEFRPEVWVEKDALKDVVARACRSTRTPYFSCRGYVSQTAMYDAAKRFQRRERQGHAPLVIHLGDHDPSGLDMTRDIQDRLSQMSWGHVEVRRIALNMDQIEAYAPPPNPAKLTDSRGSAYVDQYGYESWELDALEPAVLDRLIQDELSTVIDHDAMAERLEAEDAHVESIRKVAERFSDLWENWEDVEAFLETL